jgi:very-short-patch-repair endonuclease
MVHRMATVDVRAAEVAVLGVATDRQLRAVGISARSIRRRIEAGHWVRPSTGVVRLWQLADRRQDVLAAVLAGPGGTVASHRTAAHLQDVGGLEIPDRPDITVPRGHRYLRPDLATVHTTIRLTPVPDRLGPIPITPLPRTLRDLAGDRTVPRRVLHRTVRDALRGGTVTPDQIRAESEPRGPGRRRLREAVDLEARTVGQRTDSRLERGWADALLDAGVTGFVTQHEVTGTDRRVRLDIAWPELLIAIEVDGARFHSDALAEAADRERTTWLEQRGWTVVRVTAADLRPDRRRLALEEIRRALTRARAERRHGDG